MFASHTFRKLPLLIAAICAVSGPAVAATSAAMPDPPAVASGAMPVASTSASTGTQPAQPSKVSPSEKLADLQARIPLLQAEAAIAKLNADIATANSAAARAGMGGLTELSPPPIPVQGATGAPPAMVGHVAPTPARPAIRAVSISGFDGQYRAVIYVSGQSVSVGPGDPVSGGWTVASITESTVRLTRGSESLSLRM